MKTMHNLLNGLIIVKYLLQILLSTQMKLHSIPSLPNFVECKRYGSWYLIFDVAWNNSLKKSEIAYRIQEKIDLLDRFWFMNNNTCKELGYVQYRHSKT